MRIGFTFLGSLQSGHRQRDFQQRSASGTRLDLERSSQMADALLHSKQSEAPNALRVESASIILHAEHDSSCLAAHRDLHRSGLRVAGAIIQRLLDNPIDA